MLLRTGLYLPLRCLTLILTLIRILTAMEGLLRGDGFLPARGTGGLAWEVAQGPRFLGRFSAAPYVPYYTLIIAAH